MASADRVGRIRAEILDKGCHLVLFRCEEPNATVHFDRGANGDAGLSGCAVAAFTKRER